MPCGPNERVVSNSCVACPAGTTNAAGGHDVSGEDTECDATLCTENERVSANACVSCPAGSTNDAGDDASGDDTACEATPARRTSVFDDECTACLGGSSPAGDDARRRHGVFYGKNEPWSWTSASLAPPDDPTGQTRFPTRYDAPRSRVGKTSVSPRTRASRVSAVDERRRGRRRRRGGHVLRVRGERTRAGNRVRACDVGTSNGRGRSRSRRRHLVRYLHVRRAPGADENGHARRVCSRFEGGIERAPVCDAGSSSRPGAPCDASGTLSTPRVRGDVEGRARGRRARGGGVDARRHPVRRFRRGSEEGEAPGGLSHRRGQGEGDRDGDRRGRRHACADAPRGRIRRQRRRAQTRSSAARGASGRRLRAASYDVTLTVNPEEVDDIALVETLAAEGVTATSAEVDPTMRRGNRGRGLELARLVRGAGAAAGRRGGGGGVPAAAAAAARRRRTRRWFW